MSPSYDNLPMEDDEFDESALDFTDIEEQFQVRLDEGLDAFVVIDGLPVVPEDSKGKLVKFVLRKLNSVGKVKDEGVHMPVGDDGKTEGYVPKSWAQDLATVADSDTDMPLSSTARRPRQSQPSSSSTAPRSTRNTLWLSTS
jgi:translation initiation factor 3 subunit B